MPEEGQVRGLAGSEVCIGSPSQVEETLGWTPSATGLFTDTAVPMALLSVMSRLFPTISVIKMSKNYGSGEPFPVKWICMFLVKAFDPELVFSGSRDGRGECGR